MEGSRLVLWRFAIAFGFAVANGALVLLIAIAYDDLSNPLEDYGRWIRFLMLAPVVAAIAGWFGWRYLSTEPSMRRKAPRVAWAMGAILILAATAILNL